MLVTYYVCAFDVNLLSSTLLFWLIMVVGPLVFCGVWLFLGLGFVICCCFLAVDSLLGSELLRWFNG